MYLILDLLDFEARMFTSKVDGLQYYQNEPLQFI